jgi:hypothetical protein
MCGTIDKSFAEKELSGRRNSLLLLKLDGVVPIISVQGKEEGSH